LDALSRALVESMVAVFSPADPVLEIGSRQVQAPGVGDLRPLFGGKTYVGCDMEPGPGVDRVERIEALSFPDGWASLVLCLNVFEHAWDFRKGMEEIHRVTAPHGLALVVTAFEFHVHGYPEDYWRFTPRALERLFERFDSVLCGWQGHPKRPRLVFALGFRTCREGLEALAERWRRETLARWKEGSSGWDRFRSAAGGLLFGSRAFRALRHWRDLTIRVSERPE
jgi:SAM-dependent methyltransferase